MQGVPKDSDDIGAQEYRVICWDILSSPRLQKGLACCRAWSWRLGGWSPPSAAAAWPLPWRPASDAPKRLLCAWGGVAGAFRSYIQGRPATG